eukprot:gene28425-37523_t
MPGTRSVGILFALIAHASAGCSKPQPPRDPRAEAARELLALQGEAEHACKCERHSGPAGKNACWAKFETTIAPKKPSPAGTACLPVYSESRCWQESDDHSEFSVGTCVVTRYTAALNAGSAVTLCTKAEAQSAAQILTATDTDPKASKAKRDAADAAARNIARGGNFIATAPGTPGCTPPGCIAANPMLTARRPIRGADSGLPFHMGQPVVDEEKNRVETSGGHLGGSIQASLGGRYATALFELARDEKTLPAVEASLVAVRAAIDQSPEFQRLIASPLLGRDVAAKALAAVATSMKLDATTAKFLGVLAQNRRLSQLPAIIRAFRQLAAAQVEALKAQLKTRLR